MVKKASKSTKKTAKPVHVKREDIRVQYPAGATPAEKRALDKAVLDGGGSIWSPTEPGESIVGKLVSMNPSEKGKFGPQRTLMILPRGQKTATKVYCQTVLESRYVEKAPKIGQTIAITFQGHSKSGKKGRPAKLFGLEIV